MQKFAFSPKLGKFKPRQSVTLFFQIKLVFLFTLSVFTGLSSNHTPIEAHEGQDQHS